MSGADNNEADRGGGEDGYRHPDAVTDAALTWFVALLDGTPDAPTLAAFRAWRDSDPRHAAAFDRLVAMNGMPELRAATLAARPDPAPARPRARPAPAPRARVWWGSLAAAVLLVTIGLHLLPELLLRWRADHMTVAGDRREVTLPDGSRLLLNTASAVALDFAGGRRDVRLLRGEAFFDVVPDPARPFRVTAGHSVVEVIGTAFAVRSDAAQDAIVLERGRVSVAPAGGAGAPVLLTPGERVTASPRGLSGVAAAEPDVLLAWREGRYVFRDRPLAAVVDDLRHHHAGLILVLDDRVERARVSGNYRLDDPVGALRSLAGIAGVRMRVLPGGLILLG
ncbi:FecR family protein [Azospirillum halopraeferens]|uniref:FecR family protein n=1 Tax=Azospirillum halopraeferens TaxID=34010 RepID=UPI000417AE48|nr:FecR domain-containing protein [Azospirillum halopraeferens]